MKITLDELIIFYGEKKIDAACNVCGHERWTMLEPPTDYNFALGSTKEDGGVTIPFPTIPVVTLMCENCYNLRMHAAHPIADNQAKK